MSSDIEKLSVIDPRIVQSRPKFAVDKGALSLTNAPFNAIAATSSQHTYNIYVPSENVFVDRKLNWNSTFFLQMTVTNNSGAVIVEGAPIWSPGRDFALTAFPLNSLCSTVSATINDTTSVINSQDVLKEVLRLTDYKKNRLVRTCPTMLDKYQSCNDAFGTNNNPYGGYGDGADVDFVPNGAFNGLQFCQADGTPFPRANGVTTLGAALGGLTYNALNGVPVAPVGGLAIAGTAVIYLRITSTEPIVLSPFVFADEYEWDTGLFGINNIQMIMNLKSSPIDLIKWNNRSGRDVSAIAYNTLPAGAPFVGSRLNVQFLTPSLDVPLPPKSVVPYLEFPRYITQPGVAIPAYTVGQLASQTITLPCIPDLLIIYVKPNTVATTDGTWYMPLASVANGGVSNPVSFNFDNFSGLLSSVTTEQLYNMSAHNGLDMDWNQWSGTARSASNSVISNTSIYTIGELVATTGSILVLKPGQDLTLQSGQASSLVGNFTLQFNLQVFNNSPSAQSPSIYVITANSGFFETIRGSSRIIKGVLSEQDCISAPLAPMVVRSELDRMVGGASFKKFGHILSKAKDFYGMTKPIASAVRSMLPDSGNLGMVKDVMGKVGYGSGGSTGAGSGGRKKSLSARLM